MKSPYSLEKSIDFKLSIKYNRRDLTNFKADRIYYFFRTGVVTYE